MFSCVPNRQRWLRRARAPPKRRRPQLERSRSLHPCVLSGESQDDLQRKRAARHRPAVPAAHVNRRKESFRMEMILVLQGWILVFLNGLLVP